jgi:hypothetical protein
MSFICPKCQLSFAYKHVLNKHLLRKKPCKPCNLPITNQAIPVISTIPVENTVLFINIGFSGNSLEEVHKKILDYVNNNNLRIIEPVKNVVLEPIVEPVITPELVETFELLPVSEEIILAIIEEVQETNDLNDKISLELEKEKILEIMEKEFFEEIRRIEKIKTFTMKVDKIKILKKKYYDNIKKIKDCVKIPEKIPTLIVVKKEIVIDNVDLTLTYLNKLNDDINKNYGRIQREQDSEGDVKEMKDIIKENALKQEELINIKKALKVKKIVVDLPKFKIEEVKTNIKPEIDYITICEFKNKLSPYQVKEVMDYTYKIIDPNLSMKQRILQYIPKGMRMDHIIEIANNMD